MNSTEEEDIAAAKCGDKAAAARLIERHAGLIHGAAFRWWGGGRRNYELSDCQQEAYFGFLMAIDAYNKRGTGSKFTTVAMWYIKKMLFQMDEQSMIKVGRGVGKAFPEDVKLAKRVASLNSRVGDSTDSLGDFIQSSFEMFDELERRENIAKVHVAINSLDRRHKMIIKQRLKGLTLREIGEDLGVTGSAVSLIEQRALKRIAEMVGR